jgi:hypothetical protein
MPLEEFLGNVPNLHPPRGLNNVFQICSRNGVLLIVAEVIMGWLASRLAEIADLAAAILPWHHIGTNGLSALPWHCFGTKVCLSD